MSVRDLLARSRAGKAGGCSPIPQCPHCSMYLSTTQDLAKHLKTCRQALEDRAGIAKEQRREAIKARAASSSPLPGGKGSPFAPSPFPPGPLSEADVLRQREQEAAAFFAQSFKADASPKAPSPFSVLASAAIKGADQKIFRHHDSSLTAEDVILLFDLLAERCPGLETLDLENNKLDAESAFAVAAGLQKLPSLRRLDLDKNRLGDTGIAAVVAAVTHHSHVELLWLAKNGATEAGALAVAPGLAQMRSLKKYTCDFKDTVEARLPSVTDADKDDWNRRLRSLMGIDEVNEEKRKRAEAAKVSGAAAVQKMSAVARQRSDCSPQKIKAIRQPSFAENAEAQSKEEQDRKRREEDAARKREERKRLEELQRRKDEEEAEDAARRIVDSSSRFARLKLEEEQQQKKLQQQQADDVLKCSSPPQPACPPAVPSSQREEGAAPARAGASSPVKKYLRNELSAIALKSKSMHGGNAGSSEPSRTAAGARASGGGGAVAGTRSSSRLG